MRWQVGGLFGGTGEVEFYLSVLRDGLLVQPRQPNVVVVVVTAHLYAH